MTILAISGSSSSTSINLKLLQFTLGLLPEATEVEIVSVRDLNAPMYSTDQERESGVPESIKELHNKIQSADGVILASPEHNSSMPAMLKNAIDWLSRTEPGSKWLTKPLMLISTSPGPRGGKTNLGNLAAVTPWWGAQVVGTFSMGRFGTAFDEEANTLSDAEQLTSLKELTAKLCEAAS